jgi:putative transposase
MNEKENLSQSEVGVPIPYCLHPVAPFAEQKESRMAKGDPRLDPVRRMMVIPAKHAALQGIGHIKGKSVIHLARVYRERKRSLVGQHFWARGHFLSMGEG